MRRGKKGNVGIETGNNKENYDKAMALGGYMDWMSLQINQQTLRTVAFGQVAEVHDALGLVLLANFGGNDFLRIFLTHTSSSYFQC